MPPSSRKLLYAPVLDFGYVDMGWMARLTQHEEDDSIISVLEYPVRPLRPPAFPQDSMRAGEEG